MTDDVAERTDLVWHRALGGTPASALPGDVAICAVLEFHGLVMNGGVLNAVEENDDAFLDGVRDGYRWLGLDDVAALVAEVRGAVARGEVDDLDRAEELEVEADERYARALPDDSALESALRRRVASSPEAFAD